MSGGGDRETRLREELQLLVDSATSTSVLRRLNAIPALGCLDDVRTTSSSDIAERIPALLTEAATRISTRTGFTSDSTAKGNKPWSTVGPAIVELLGLGRGGSTTDKTRRLEDAAHALGLKGSRAGSRWEQRLITYLVEELLTTEQQHDEKNSAIDAESLEQVFRGQPPQRIETVLISVGRDEDRARLDPLCDYFTENAIEMVATPGNARYLQHRGYNVATSWEYVKADPIGTLRGTMHPYVLAAIACRPDYADDRVLLEEHDLRPIDLQRLGRAVIELAMREVEAEQRAAEQHSNEPRGSKGDEGAAA